MTRGEAALSATLRARMDDWLHGWGVAGGEPAIRIHYSTRMYRSLARCHPETARIALRADLETAGESLLAEVLCHELAHIAAYRLHGRGIAPHGREWRALVSAAGFVPRTRMPAASCPPPRVGHRPGYLYEHCCPVCHVRRAARRPMRNWRCVACLDAGRDGRLQIRRHHQTGGSDRF